MAAGQLSRVIEHLRSVMARKEAVGRPDGELVRRYVRDGDEAAFEGLVRRHGAMVLGVCRRVLQNQHDAEDAFQATFLVLVRKAATLRSPGMVGNWLYGVAYRTALHARKAAGTRRAKEAEVMAPGENSADVWAELKPVLDQELERLADKYRVLVVLCDLQGRTRKEVAGLLGMPEGTVASRLAKARELLAKGLTKRGVTVSSGSLAGALAAEAASAAVPITVSSSTVKAAAAFAAGQVAVGVISGQVLALTEGVLKMMMLSKIKMTAVVLMACAVFGTTAAGVAYQRGGWEPNGEVVVAGGQSKQPIVTPQTVGQEVKELRAEVERLRDENAMLKTKLDQLHQQSHLPPIVGEGQPGDERKLHLNIFQLINASPEEVPAIVNAVKQTIAPASWVGAGGTGSIECVGKNLVVSQSVEVMNIVRVFVEKMEAVLHTKRLDKLVSSRRIYPVADLSGKDGTSLIRVITSTIEPTSWMGSGGSGAIEYFSEGQCLVIRQFLHVHEGVGLLLEDLRKAKGEQEKKKVP